jgi:hypothetical protein
LGNPWTFIFESIINFLMTIFKSKNNI